MHHWEKGGPINIGWPDHDVPEREYTIVEVQRLGQVFRIRVTDGKKEGGFLVVFDCPEVVLEMLAESATCKLGFKVIVSNLRCGIEGNVLRSFDYEWFPPLSSPPAPATWFGPSPKPWMRCGTQADLAARRADSR